MEYTVLNNGVRMPLVGLGVMEIENGAAGEQVILNALNAGYRMIDTATVYFNEETVGAAIRKSGIPREELFITSKFWVQDAGYENTRKAFQLSLDKLGLDYLDNVPCSCSVRRLLRLMAGDGRTVRGWKNSRHRRLQFLPCPPG